MDETLQYEQLTLLEKMKKSMIKGINRPSKLFKNMVQALEKIINLNNKPVTQANAYQYVRQHEQLINNTRDYIDKNKGARTEKGKERLAYAGQIMNMMDQRSVDGLRDPMSTRRLRGRPLGSLTEEDFTAIVQSPRIPEAPSVVSHQGVQRWFTPIESGGNKNVAAGRLGALLGLQSVTGSDQKTVIHGKNGMVEGSLQSVSDGVYIHNIADAGMSVSYNEKNFHKEMSGLTLIRFLTGGPEKAVDSLLLNSEMADQASNGKMEVKLTGIRETDHSASFERNPGMAVSGVKVISKEVADNLRMLNEDMLHYALKDVLSKDQISQLGGRLNQVKENLVNIKIVENGMWSEEDKKLNQHSPVYSEIEKLLGPEARLTGQKPPVEKTKEAVKDTVLGAIPPAPPLPATKAVSIQELQAEEKKIKPVTPAAEPEKLKPLSRKKTMSM